MFCFHVLVYSYSVSHHFTHYKNGIVRNSEYLWKVLKVFLTLHLGNPSLLHCMCKSEHAYTLTVGLHPEDIAITRNLNSTKTFQTELCYAVVAARGEHTRY